MFGLNQRRMYGMRFGSEAEEEAIEKRRWWGPSRGVVAESRWGPGRVVVRRRSGWL